MSDQKRKGDDLPALDDQESKRQKMTEAEAVATSPDDRQVALADAIQKEGQINEEIAEITRQYKCDIALANSKLIAAKRKTEKARTAIRSAGEAEYDSLLSLEMDSITHMLGYLDIQSLGRCEVASRQLRQAATPAWEVHAGPPQNRSVASDERERVRRFHLASMYAHMCEPWIEKHNDYDYNHTADRKVYDKYNRGYCRKFDPEGQFYDSEGEEIPHDDYKCCFPGDLETEIFERPQDFEVFIRVRRAYHGEAFFEGFIPSDHVQVEPRENRNNDNGTLPTLAINFLGLDFPNWPGMNRCLSLDPQKNKEEWQKLSRNMFHDEGYGLLTTIIAVEKGKPLRAVEELKQGTFGGLLAAFCEYSRNNDAVDNGGDPVYPFEHFEERHHFRVEGCIPVCLHYDIFHLPWEECRYLWFAWSKSDPGKFGGILIADGRFREGSRQD